MKKISLAITNSTQLYRNILQLMYRMSKLFLSLHCPLGDIFDRKRLAYSLSMNLDNSNVLKEYGTFSFGFVYSAFCIRYSQRRELFFVYLTQVVQNRSVI